MERITLLGETLVEVFGIDDVAVVSEGQGIRFASDNHRLAVHYPAGTPGRIAGVTDGDIAGKLAERVLIEYLGYKSHIGVNLEFGPVCGGNSGAFLAAML